METISFSSACVIYIHIYSGVKALFGKHWEKKLFNLNKRLTLTILFWFRVSLKGNHYLANHYLLLTDWRL